MIKQAKIGNLNEINEVYEKAKLFMRTHGNDKQWINGYPQDEMLINDINSHNLYICYDEKGIYAVFAFILGEDQTYKKIVGSWLDDTPYGTIHRIASNQKHKNVLHEVVQYCQKKISHLRIDTHEINHVMRNAVSKEGFKECGIITIADGSERVAYELIESVKNADK